jgi:hypothetical protein
MSISCVFLTKKSLKIHSMKESIKINRLLNTNKHFKSVEKSQFNTNRFYYPEKKNSIVLIEYHKIYLTFIKIFIEYIPQDFFIIKKSFKILSNLNSIHPPYCEI